MSINDKKRYVPAFHYSTGEADERPPRELIEVSDEVYSAYYRPIWQVRDYAKRNGGCSTADWRKCSGDCGTCAHHIPSRTHESYEALLDGDDEESPWEIDDVAVQVSEAIMQSEHLKAINALDSESQLICRAVAAGMNERDAAKLLGVSKTTFHDRKQRLFAKLREAWADLR